MTTMKKTLNHKNLFEALKQGRGFQPNEARHSTTALPGSCEKIAIMQQRMLNGEELYHPQDISFPFRGVPEDEV